MYLSCDGTLTVLGDDSVTCDNWVTVTEEELLGLAINANKLTQDDFNAIMPGFVTILLLGFGFRMLFKLISERY